jgi:hypothetical protein
MPTSPMIEKALEEMYTQFLCQQPTGMTFDQALDSVKEAIKQCKEQAREEGSADLPANYGDLSIKAAESGEPSSGRIVDKYRREGATVEDIRELWNLDDLQRRMVEWWQNVYRVAYVMSRLKPGFSEDEKEKLALDMRKMFPRYGDPDDTSIGSGDDRPLPYVLRGRVDRWRMRMGECEIRDKTSKSSTFNALVREEMRKGSL